MASGKRQTRVEKEGTCSGGNSATKVYQRKDACFFILKIMGGEGGSWQTIKARCKVLDHRTSCKGVRQLEAQDCIQHRQQHMILWCICKNKQKH